MRKGLIIAACVFVPVVFLSGLVGWRTLQLQSRYETKPAPDPVLNESVDPYLKVPLPDPDSDVLFGVDDRNLSILRYSPAKGFWGAERGFFRSIGHRLQVDGGHYMFATSWGLFPTEIVAVDLQSSRPWAASSVTEILGTLNDTAFDATRHRY